MYKLNLKLYSLVSELNVVRYLKLIHWMLILSYSLNAIIHLRFYCTYTMSTWSKGGKPSSNFASTGSGSIELLGSCACIVHFIDKNLMSLILCRYDGESVHETQFHLLIKAMDRGSAVASMNALLDWNGNDDKWHLNGYLVWTVIYEISWVCVCYSSLFASSSSLCVYNNEDIRFSTAITIL